MSLPLNPIDKQSYGTHTIPMRQPHATKNYLIAFRLGAAGDT
jgi:hypothetical protein